MVPESKSGLTDPTPITSDEKLELFLFNRAGQLCEMRSIFTAEKNHETCEISPNIKSSKENHLVAIPLLKQHILESEKFSTVEFAFLDTTSLQLTHNKLRINVLAELSWDYDLT